MSSRLEQLANEISNAVDWYLDNAGGSKEANILMFRKQIDQYGGLLIELGLLQICIRLRKVAMDTMSPQFRAGPMASAGDKMIINTGLNWIAVYSDVVIELAKIGIVEGNESKGYGDLILSLRDDNEDVSALAAIILALPTFHKPLTKDHLREAYKQAKGTGLRIAIAYALLAEDDTELCEKFALRFLIEEPSLLHAAIIDFQKNRPYETLAKIKSEVYKAFAHPRAPELVCFDIATDGLGPKHMFPDWTRKSYQI